MLCVNARFLTQNISGVQRHAIEISRQLKKLNNDISFISPKNIIHNDLASELNATCIGNLTGHLWEQIELPKYLKSNNKPILLNLANTAPVLYGNNIVTLHDISFIRFPKNFSWKFRFAYKIAIPLILKKSKLILTDSIFSKNEIASVYNIDPINIKVVHCAVSKEFQYSAANIKDKYILAVSSQSYHKNFHALIKSFNSLTDKSVKLYLVGAINGNFADHKLAREINGNENIKFMGRVEDAELVQLYSNAQCFVYPSLYEGFGIPPLEAQACGCPCVVSNVASLPEVCGASVIYCNPYSTEDISEKIQQVISDEACRKNLKAKGYENIMRFSWKKSAEKILKIVDENK